MAIKSSTGRWVVGEDFFDREKELQLLESHVTGGNHVLLTGQRRMGKTSIARELGRRLKGKGWIPLFADVEGATCPEDVITDIAEALHPIRPVWSRVSGSFKRFFGENIEEFSAHLFRLKFRAGFDGKWRRHGKELIDSCVAHDSPVLLIIDEFPIFLMRMLRSDDGPRRVDEFLSWLRGVLQGIDPKSTVLVVAGSIGLAPLFRRLGIPNRIDYLYSFRVGPWDRQTSVGCFESLAESHELAIEDGVADAVYEALGIGVPHHVQYYFARLRELAVMNNLDRVKVSDVGYIYMNELLSPTGQNDLAHYEFV